MGVFTNCILNVKLYLFREQTTCSEFRKLYLTPFLFKLDEFKELVKDYRDVADFLVVYIAEAHATGKY